MQKLSFLRSTMSQNEISGLHYFKKNWHVEKVSSQIWTRCKIFNSDSDALYFFKIQNLTHCFVSNSKSDPLHFCDWKSETSYFFENFNLKRCFFKYKIWHVVKILIETLLFESRFQILAQNLSKYYQHQRTTCWKKATACVKKLSCECVAGACITFGIFFAFCDLCGNWVLGGFDD